MSKFTKIAEQLAENYVTRQEKWAAVTDYLRPENKEHPGMNWYTGPGLGTLAFAHELGRGENSISGKIENALARYRHVGNIKSHIQTALSEAGKKESKGKPKASDLVKQTLNAASSSNGNTQSTRTLKDIARYMERPDFDITGGTNAATHRSELRRLFNQINPESGNPNHATMKMSDARLSRVLTSVMSRKAVDNGLTAQLRRAGTAAGVVTGLGGYVLPSLIAKWRKGGQQ